MSAYDYDIAVVGVGAIGGVLANLLGAQGLRAVAFDRSAEGVQLPRGVGLDGEIMRVAQAVGLAGRLEPLMQPFPGAQYLDAAGNLVSTRPARTTVGSQGWPDRYQFHQPDFERVFRAGLTAHESLDLRLGWEADEVRFGPDGGGVVTATETATGQRATVTVRYVVGCDGARSLVRRAAGISYDDLGLNQPWIVVDLEINDDVDLPAVNTHYADPERPVIYINVVRNVRRYEFRAGPDEDLDGALEPDAIWERVARWIRPDQATLVRAAVYTHRSLVAQAWRKGPLIVAGDAAHQTPPFMGQGLCAGVRDASALAWRLGAIINDGAADSLLDSYETERSEHARVIIEAATKLGQVYTKPDKTKLETINASIGREGQGQTPRLGPGLWTGGGPGGTLAPQPRLADGRLLDDAAGYRFAVIGSAEVLGTLPARTRHLAEASGFRIIEASGDAAGWLADLGARAVIVRPDRYYYGTFDGAADLDEAVAGLAGVVAPDRISTSHATDEGTAMPNNDGTDYKSIWMWLKEVPFTQQYVVANGIRTRVATAGDPKNPAVTLLHGTGGHWEAYAPTIGALAEDYFVIAPDYVGCGFTDKPKTPWTIKTYQDHVLGLLDHFGVRKSTFFGMSLGAWIAGSLGRDYPERTNKLVLMSPAGVLVKTGNMERIRRERTQAVEGADWDSIKVLFDHLIASEDNKIPDIIATRLAIYKRDDTRETIDSMLYLQQPGIQEDNLVTEEQWKSIQAPVLLTQAGKDVEDFQAASQQLKKWIPNVESFEMPEVAHWPSFEDPEAFNPVMLKFLAK